jgi:putative DNA methylase
VDRLGNGGFSMSLARHALFAMREVVRTDEVKSGKNWLRMEVQDYWPQRKHLLEILRYLSTMGFKLPHWQVDAKATQLLAGAVENDNV